MKTETQQDINPSHCARIMLRERWGAARSIDSVDYQWLCAHYGKPGKKPDALAMALEIAGLKEQYEQDGSPKWHNFREWIERHA